MQSLFERADDVSIVERGKAHIRRLSMRFGHASPDRLPEGSLPATYMQKPLVTFHGAAMFGELAVLRWLEVDGWEGVWLDTIHGRKAWRQMPTVSSPVMLPVYARTLYDRIVDANGGRASGAFDVMAWMEGHTIFVEYEGPGSVVKRNQPAWIKAARSVGVSENDLILVSAHD